MKPEAIYKYAFLMNEHIHVSSLARNLDEALRRLRGLFGQDERYDLISTTFSHNVGDYSITNYKRVPEAKASAIEEKEEDLMENVMSAYAKDKKVTL